MAERRVLALYAGLPGRLVTPSGEIESAIAKRPVEAPLRVEGDGLPGDAQVSPGHGGPDRALCLYPSEHLGHWEARTGGPVPAPAFGQNLTSAGVLEPEVAIGETWRIGAALVQVTQPRSPCHKVAARLGLPDLVADARATGFVGLHLRVLEPGELAAGDAIEPVERPEHGVTVADAVRARFARAADPRLIAAVLAAPELAAEWREKTAPRLARAA